MNTKFGLTIAFYATTLFSLSDCWPQNRLPLEVSAAINKSYPKAIILRSNSCRPGEAKVESFGLLLQLPRSSKSKHPLKALITFRKDKHWEISEVSTALQSSKGHDQDFLANFWSNKNALDKYQIRCTSPFTDADINTQASGEFSKEFEKINASTLHICFQASPIYNNWACSTFDSAINNMRTSFTQLNAD